MAYLKPMQEDMGFEPKPETRHSLQYVGGSAGSLIQVRLGGWERGRRKECDACTVRTLAARR
jgi:hypothetical protein